MSWHQVLLGGSLGAYCADWDALNARYYGGHPFQDSRFVDGLLKHWSSGTERLCIYQVDGRIEGLLILVPVRMGVWRQFSPSQLQAAPVLLPHAEVLDGVFSCLPGFALLVELMAQDPQYAPPGLFDADSQARIIPYVLTMNVRLDGTFDAYCSVRPNKVNQNLRRYERKALELYGEPRLRRITQPAEMPEAVERYGVLESSGWKGKEGTALHRTNIQGRFYAEVMARFALSGQAEVMELLLGDQLVASRLIVYGQDIAVTLKTTFNESLAQVAPGRLLLNRLLQVFFEERKFASVEFYTNATQDQLAWATGQRTMSHIMWFRSPALAGFYDTVQQIQLSSWKPLLERPFPQRGLSADRHESLDGLPRDATAMIALSEAESFDFSVEWLRLLVRAALPEGARPCVYVMRRAETAICVLPLLVNKGQVTGLTTFYSSLFRPFLADDVTTGELAWLFRKVAQDLKPSRLMFSPMAVEHGSYEQMRKSLRRAGLATFRFFAHGNWYLPCEGLGYEAYLSGLPSRIRNTLKRKEKKFFADGRGRIGFFTGGKDDPAPLGTAISAWSAIYGASWKVPEPFPEFMPGLIGLHARQKSLRLAIAYYDEAPIAAQVWLVTGGRASIYKLAYDEHHAEHSAGTILTAFLFRRVLDDDKVREVDYLVGDDPYKQEWGTHRRERWGLVAYSPRTLRGLAGLADEVARRVFRYCWPGNRGAARSANG